MKNPFSASEGTSARRDGRQKVGTSLKRRIFKFFSCKSNYKNNNLSFCQHHSRCGPTRSVSHKYRLQKRQLVLETNQLQNNGFRRIFILTYSSTSKQTPTLSQGHLCSQRSASAETRVRASVSVFRIPGGLRASCGPVSSPSSAP